MNWAALQLRRLADARAATAGMVGLVVVTSFLFGVAPRLIDAEADRALRSTVASAAPDTRGISLTQAGRVSVGSPDPLAIVKESGDEYQQRFPGSVSAVIGGSYAIVDTPRFRPSGREAMTLRLRYLQGASDRVTLTSGQLPTAKTTLLPIEPGAIINEVNGLNRDLAPRVALTTFEVALSESSAADLHVSVGDTVMLRTDQTDKLAGFAAATIAIRVTGTYKVNDAAADFWFSDTSLDRPQIRSLSSLNQIDDLTALVAPDAYKALYLDTAPSGLPMQYTWRYEVDTTRLRAGGIDLLSTDLRRLESVFLAESTPHSYSYVGPISETGPISLQTGLGRLVAAYSGGWRAVSQILSIAEVGAAAVACLALGLVCLLAGRRRAGSLALWQSRGASRSHLLRAAATEIAVEVVPPVLLGIGIAILLTPSRALEPTLAGSGAVFALAIALILTDTMSSGTAGDGGSAGAGNRGRGRGSEGGRGLAALTRGATPRRLVMEAAVIAVAGAGAFLLRQRGVEAARSDTALASPDPLVAAVPVLIGAAAALLVVRLLPLPLDLMSRLAQRGRGLVALLALRRATRRTNDRLLLSVLLTMAAVWSFAAVSLSSLGRAADAASWQTVGADYRVSLREGQLPPELALGGIPGVQSVARAAVIAAHVPEKNNAVSVMAIDAASYRDVTANGLLDGVLPGQMVSSEVAAAPSAAPGASGAPGAGAGSSPATSGAQAASLPVIVSTTLAADTGMKPGDTVDLIVGGTRPTFTVAAVRDTFPTLPAGTRWLVVARSNLAAVTHQEILPTMAFLRGGVAAKPAIAAFIQARLPGVGLVASRDDASTALHAGPTYSAVIFGLWAASLIAAAYGALAIFAALLLAGAEQSREAAHLRVLGLSRAQGLGLSAMEHGPAAILVISAGIALGVGLFGFLQSSLGLGGLVGGQVEATLQFGLLDIATILGAVGLVVAVAIGLETAAQSIITPTAALRRGMD